MGVDSYIVKPFDEDMLLTRIRNILETRERYQQKFVDEMSVETLEISEESNDKKFMDQVMGVMNDNYQNSSFEVTDFAEAMGVSKSLLNKKLKALSGKSAGEFIRIYRLNLAYNIILQNKKTKNKNIADVAYDVGFNDPKYFTRCFSRQFNITPSNLLEK
jgi:AraC-like DNA-binding protein